MYLKQADRLRLQMQARHALPAPERADGDVALPQGTHHAMIFLAYAYRGLSETRQVADPRGRGLLFSRAATISYIVSGLTSGLRKDIL